MDKPLLHRHEDFSELVLVTAAALKVDASIVEKDYWVFEALRRMSASSEVGLLFKGGTSLSMAYGLIRRFSEDIDLIVFDKSKGIGHRIGQSRGGTLLERARDFACDGKDLTFDSAHAENFSGKSPSKRVCVLRYPKDMDAAQGVLPYIKLEMAVHSGAFPHEMRPIESLLARQIRKTAPAQLDIFANVTPVEVACLSLLRTLAEKVNALNAAFLDGELPQKGRHYYDLYYLLGETSVVTMLGSEEHNEIKRSIRDIDRIFRQEKPADHYERSGSGGAFLFDRGLVDTVKSAYDASPIYYGEKPAFDEIVALIGKHSHHF